VLSELGDDRNGKCSEREVAFSNSEALRVA
jgi:hypothetical protein